MKRGLYFLLFLSYACQQQKKVLILHAFRETGEELHVDSMAWSMPITSFIILEKIAHYLNAK